MEKSQPAGSCWLLLAAAAAALLGCQPAAEDEPGNAQVPAEPVVNLPVALPSPALDRTAILKAVAEAASARVAGADDSAAQRDLDGRLFEFRIRFGCRGPRSELGEAVLGWSRDSDTGTLRIRAMPTISRDTDIVQRVAPPEVEEVEGFWVPRPWLLSAVCPAAAAASARQGQQDVAAPASAAADRPATGARPPTQPARQAPGAPRQVSAAQPRGGGDDVQESIAPPPAHPRVGIAQFFTATDPRTGRRSDRPYQAVKTVPPEQLVGAQGFNLVLSGRLRAIPGKGVIHCVASGPDSPPDCIVSADIDRVWIEQPGERAPIAEWGGG